MTQLAIKGHPTRGEEVIEILEMMGYFNFHDYTADTDSLCFYGCEITNRVYYDWVNSCEDMLIFTLEDFLEKFPYKVGDKVRTIYGKIGIISKPIWSNRDECIRYELEADTDSFYFVNELQPYKEETMEIKPNQIKNKNAFIDIANAEYNDVNTIELLCSDMFDVEIIHEDKIVLKRKKPQYPKSYDECVDMFNFTVETANLETFKALRELIYCRNSYWKIAGEQMGLGEPWEPDWESESTPKYTISQAKNKIRFLKAHEYNHILSFPTAEMREAFYENFKYLIESCKELL